MELCRMFINMSLFRRTSLVCYCTSVHRLSTKSSASIPSFSATCSSRCPYFCCRKSSASSSSSPSSSTAFSSATSMLVRSFPSASAAAAAAARFCIASSTSELFETHFTRFFCIVIDAIKPSRPV
jgi:hypothetical protein